MFYWAYKLIIVWVHEAAPVREDDTDREKTPEEEGEEESGGSEID